MSSALSDVTLKLMGVGHVFQIPVCSKSPCITLTHTGDLDSAFLLFEEVLEKRRRILGDQHPDTISATNKHEIVLETKSNIRKPKSMEGSGINFEGQRKRKRPRPSER